MVVVLTGERAGAVFRSALVFVVRRVRHGGFVVSGIWTGMVFLIVLLRRGMERLFGKGGGRDAGHADEAELAEIGGVEIMFVIGRLGTGDGGRLCRGDGVAAKSEQELVDGSELLRRADLERDGARIEARWCALVSNVIETFSHAWRDVRWLLTLELHELTGIVGGIHPPLLHVGQKVVDAVVVRAL